jgi:predicted O-linked N-acetylglucosamine transferase (SPINDLY family)
VNFLGFPGTTGAPFFDYIVADRHVIPPRCDSAYSENIVRLPDSYQVNDDRRTIADVTPSRTELGLPERGFVFCSFNNSYKIRPSVFAAWMRLLQRVEGSVLWLIDDNAAATANLRRHAERHGVAAARLIFAPRVPLDQHLARHRCADLFLDTFPYTAHTTGSDALWAGLPLLTLTGEAFASRVASSLLNAVGLPELVTDTLPAYEALALELATTPERLAALKAKLANQRPGAPLFDTDRFRRHIESAYWTMYDRLQRGEPPAAFDVAAIG